VPPRENTGSDGLIVAVVEFYKKTAILCALLIIGSLVVGAAFMALFLGSKPLLPASESFTPWHSKTITEKDWIEEDDLTETNDAGVDSVIEPINTDQKIEFSYQLSDEKRYPYAKFFLIFNRYNTHTEFTDLSRFHKVSFKVRCSEHGIFTVNFRIFDPSVTDIDDLGSYRVASSWFDCAADSRYIDADLRKLEVPTWWLGQYGLDLHKRGYSLSNTYALSFDTSRRGPVGMPVNIQVTELQLHYYNWLFLIAFGVLFVSIWGCFVIWSFRQYSHCVTQTVKQKLENDKPLEAYQRLAMEEDQPESNKEESAVLQYMAKEYANADLNMDTMVAALGINNVRINQVLKQEIGYTFKAYLNKLRLTEAARLLSTEPDASITEIADLVGYKNVTYFNKVFKDEYSCSPGKFKQLKNMIDTDGLSGDDEPSKSH